MPFVSVEGIDGSGKTEQVARLVARLSASGVTVLRTKEPDGGHIGGEIRAILTKPDRQLSPVEQLLLVSAARYDHVRNVVEPVLAEGGWVVSDRFTDSTHAFQAAVSGSDLGPLLREVNEAVVGSTRPDLTIILDLPVEKAMKRRATRGDQAGDPSEATRDFHAIRRALLDLASADPQRYRVVDAVRTPEDVAEDVFSHVEALRATVRSGTDGSAAGTGRGAS